MYIYVYNKKTNKIYECIPMQTYEHTQTCVYIYIYIYIYICTYTHISFTTINLLMPQ